MVPTERQLERDKENERGAKGAKPSMTNEQNNKPAGSIATNAVELNSFRANCDPLSDHQRRVIVQQALVLLQENYVHLSMKQALYGVDPVQRLNLLLIRVERDRKRERLSDDEFHREMLETFFSLRDPHTRYRLPECWEGKIAFLPFTVEDIHERRKRKYIVSKLLNFSDGTFVEGVEIRYWNGVPIERAVFEHGQHCAASNREAQHAEGVMSLTLRPLRDAPAPDEHWVDVGYRTLDGKLLWKRFDWKVGGDPRPQAHTAAARRMEMNIVLATIRRTRRELFPGQLKRLKNEPKDIATAHADVFAARPVATRHGRFGYLRIWNFQLEENMFVKEFVRLLGELPQNGLIIDIRDNPGGEMSAAEYVLQTLTPKRIEPEPVQFVNTPLNLAICRARRPSGQPVLRAWAKPIEEGLQTGARYSVAFPKSSPQQCNIIGQKYFGPVVLVTDALTYSAADMFAAGFQDHGIGPIVGADRRTGAGGANCWAYEDFRKYRLAKHRSLAAGVGFRVAIRRSLRVGARAGAVLEDFGVTADKYHPMTRNDVLARNVDLIDTAAELLRKAPKRGLTIGIARLSANKLKVTARTKAIRRLDFYVDDRPRGWTVVRQGRARFVIDASTSRRPWLEVRGFDKGKLVARYRTQMTEKA